MFGQARELSKSDSGSRAIPFVAGTSSGGDNGHSGAVSTPCFPSRTPTSDQ